MHAIQEVLILHFIEANRIYRKATVACKFWDIFRKGFFVLEYHLSSIVSNHVRSLFGHFIFRSSFKQFYSYFVLLQNMPFLYSHSLSLSAIRAIDVLFNARNTSYK